MNNTHEIEIGLDLNEIIKKVFAESAWIASCNPAENELSDVINHDNKGYLELLARRGLLWATSRLSGFITGYRCIEDDSKLPVLKMKVPCDLNDQAGTMILGLLEEAMTSLIINRCYIDLEKNKVTSDHYYDNAITSISRLRILLNDKSQTITPSLF